MKLFKYILLGILLMPVIGHSQQHRIDSLQKVLKTEKEDTNKVNALTDLASALRYTNPDSTILLGQQALSLIEKLGWSKGEATAYNVVGIGYWAKGDYPKALDYYLKALKMVEGVGNKQGQANELGNIGAIYDEQEDYAKALDYYLKALKMAEELGNKRVQAMNLGNIGTVYFDQRNYLKALDYDIQALRIAEETGDKGGQAADLINIGVVYDEKGDYLNALFYDLKALKIDEEMGNEEGQASDFGNIGDLYSKTGKYKEAEEYLKKSIALDSSIGGQNELRLGEESISQLYNTTRRYKLALTWYKKAMALKDTLFNTDKNKALTRKELTYKYEKKADSAKAEQARKDLMTEADRRKQAIVIWSVCAGLLLVLIFAGFIFRSLRITRRQKDIIEVKNKETEEQKKNILDSITYAKRLQDAILPPLSIIKKYLPDSFLLYKPKDIVAGDFYWMWSEATSRHPSSGENQNDIILIAAADCTGHGVPGAMVSVVCSNALNQTVKEFKITEPGKILDKVRELVLETFEKSENEVQDGMDVSLCCLNIQTKEIQWSGANNPLWYVQNGELKEVAPDKQPIGKFNLAKPFNTASLKLQKGDILYLFTDGYADQFGGPKGKKFKYKQLQEKLLAVASMNMDKQKEMLDETIESWKGSLEQVDDILIMGIRV